MQDRYAGDIGDYGKFILLRHFARRCGLSVGIVWHKVDGTKEANNDGKHTGYLAYVKPHCLQNCDPELFSGLKHMAAGSERGIGALEQLLTKLSPGIRFFSRLSTEADRENWNQDAFDAMHGVDMVFFDPDNGIVESGRVSPKHVHIYELKRYFCRGQALFIYHHLNRSGSHKSQILKVQRILSEKLRIAESEVIPYVLRRGSARVFFLVIHKNHKEKIGAFIQCSAFEPLNSTKSEWAKRLLR